MKKEVAEDLPSNHASPHHQMSSPYSITRDPTPVSHLGGHATPVGHVTPTQFEGAVALHTTPTTRELTGFKTEHLDTGDGALVEGTPHIVYPGDSSIGLEPGAMATLRTISPSMSAAFSCSQSTADPSISYTNLQTNASPLSNYSPYVTYGGGGGAACSYYAPPPYKHERCAPSQGYELASAYSSVLPVDIQRINSGSTSKDHDGVSWMYQYDGAGAGMNAQPSMAYASVAWQGPYDVSDLRKLDHGKRCGSNNKKLTINYHQKSACVKKYIKETPRPLKRCVKALKKMNKF